MNAQAWFDYDLGALTVLVLGVFSLAALALTI
jgi:hypothetical protein